MKMANGIVMNLSWDIFISGAQIMRNLKVAQGIESGPGNYTVAIVELPDGRIVMPVADDIVFLDCIEKD